MTDQSIHPNTRSFVYADDFAVTAQNTDFTVIEEALSPALDGLQEYYATNTPRANPTKIYVTFFRHNR